MQSVLYDAAGHRRSPVTLPGFHEGRAPRNKSRRYPADPPTVEEIIAVMRQAGSSPEGLRLRALIVILWRAGLRIGEALDLAETDLGVSRGAVLVRRGKGGRRRDGSVGVVTAGSVAGAAARVAGWCAVVRGPRRDRRPALGRVVSPQTTRAYRGPGRRAPAVRAPSTASRPRCRDGARGRAACCHPAPARARQPGRDVDLSAGDRQLRDHRHRSLPTSAGHLRDGRADNGAVARPRRVAGGRGPPIFPRTAGARPMSPTYPYDGKAGLRQPRSSRSSLAARTGCSTPERRTTPLRSFWIEAAVSGRWLGLVPDCWCLVDDRSLGVAVVAIGHNGPSRTLPAVRARIAA